MNEKIKIATRSLKTKTINSAFSYQLITEEDIKSQDLS